MSSPVQHATLRLRQLLRALQQRYWLRALGFAAPLLLLIGAALAWSGQLSPNTVLVLLAVSASLFCAAAVMQAHRRYRLSWLLLQLDGRLPELEDSATLLLHKPESQLAALQQARLLQRLDRLDMPDLRVRWRPLALIMVWLLSAGALLAMHNWPYAPSPLTSSVLPASPEVSDNAGFTELIEAQLQISAPAYTGVAEQLQSALDVRAPEGATVHFKLRFEPVPAAAALQFVDGQQLPLILADGSWSASMPLQRDNLYRLSVDSAAPLRERSLHTLAVIADTPPQLRVLNPQLSLTRHTPGQSHWSLELEASDDYGLGAAQLLLTRTQGTGEQVTVSEQRIALEGRGNARQRRYSHRIDLIVLGLAEGDDLIARFEVSDRRQPQPQRSRSSSYILRWPAPAMAEASGVEGLVNTTLPAYFRSQRQIIIDTEALLAETPRRPAEDFGIRADEIGVDQRLLRLRYGQFLGEEFEPPPAPPGLGVSEAHSDDEHAGHDHHPGDGHDHGPATDSAKFGDAGAVQAEYGHVHDIAEAATLLDPATRKLLKAALDEMWQAELYLRSAQPKAALPYEYRALELIKQVQQGSRIYLARVGLELPPIDFERRFSGDRTGLRPRTDPLPGAQITPDPLVVSWRMLDHAALANSAQNPTQASADLQRSLTDLIGWLSQSDLNAEQRLPLLASIDSVQQDPTCASCLAQLRASLWPLLRVPTAVVAPRNADGGAAQAYLDALDESIPTQEER